MSARAPLWLALVCVIAGLGLWIAGLVVLDHPLKQEAMVVLARLPVGPRLRRWLSPA